MDTLSDSQFHEVPPPRRGSALPWLLFVLTLVAAGGLGYLGYGMWEGEREKAAAAVRSSEEAGSRMRALDESKRALEAQLASLEQEKSALSEERNALTEEVKAKDSELAKLKATYDSLNEKMTAEINKGEIHLTQLAGRIRVDLVDKILFDSGSAELSGRGGEVLARIGDVLAKVDDKQIQVSGHTDDSPIVDKQLAEKFPSNWELSTARAVNVVRFLSEKAKVPAKRLLAAGYGQFQPVATNANPTGRARNRRIEILLTPLLDAKPTKELAVAKAAPAPAPARAAAPAKAAPAAVAKRKK